MHHSIDSLESRLVLSAPVDLDPTFANGGAFAPPAPTESLLPLDSARLNDGRTLVLSLRGDAITSEQSLQYTGSVFVVQRFRAAGTIDQSFGVSGTTVVLDKLSASKATIGVSPTGDIYVAAHFGNSYQGATGVRLARLSTDGIIDRSFADNGILRVLMRSVNVYPRLSFTDSRVYLAQETYEPERGITIVALRPDGTYETRFGDNGVVRYPAAEQDSVTLADILIDNQATVTIAFDAYDPAIGVQAHAVRYTASGRFDTTFGQNGVVQLNEAYLADAELDPQSRLIMGFSDGGVVRLTRGGALDVSFATDGIGRVSFNNSPSHLIDLAVDAQSRIYALGDSGRPALRRLNVDGTLDRTYGRRGEPLELNTLRPVRGSTVSVDSTNNSATIVGRAFYYLDLDSYSYDTRGHITPVATRVSARGRLDQTFGIAGVSDTLPIGTLGRFVDLKTLPDGKILALGRTLTPRGENFMLYRFTADGAVDSTFAAGRGFALIDFAGGHDVAARMEVQADGKIIVAGATTNADRLNDWAIARLNADGSIDGGFGTEGKVVLNIRGALERVVAVALLSNGKILATGNTEGQIATARFTRSGAMDQSFGINGMALTSPRVGESSLSAQDMIVLNDGRILVLGTNRNSENSQARFLARYSAGGMAEASFGRDGRRQISGERGTAADSPRRMLKLASGEIIIQHGYSSVSRLNSDGSYNSYIGGSYSGAPAVQRDGKIIIAGDGVERLNPHGSNDATFSAGTIFDSQFRAVELTLDERILLAGEKQLVPTLIRTLGETATRPKIASVQDGKLTVRGTTSNDRIELRRDGSRLLVIRNGDFVTFDFNSINAIEIDGLEDDDHIAVNLDKNNVTVWGGEGNDTLDASEAGRRATLVGGAGGDLLIGGDGADSLDGGDGDDTFTGNGGADVFTGGADSDTADYSERTIGVTVSKNNLADDGAPGERDNVRSDVEIVVGSRGNDLLIGSINRDTLMGMEGNDTLRGGASRDSLYGDGGNDLLQGDEGNDSLDGGDGANSLFGNAGNDSLLAGPGRDQFAGGSGFDFVFYGSYSVGEVSEFGNIFESPSFIRRVARVREDALRLSLDGQANDGATGERDLIGADIEALFGGNGNDFITGSTIGNRLDGRGGDDTINGGAGNDTITDEDRRSYTSTGTDLLQGGDGDDILVSRDVLADTLDGGAGFDQINANEFYGDTLLNYELLSGQQ